MARDICRVTFQPEGRSAFAAPGTRLTDAAAQAGISLSQPCGGEGTCGKCRLEVLAKAPPPTAADVRHIPAQQLAEGWRLACQMTIENDLVVSIPQQTRALAQVVLVHDRKSDYGFEPNIRKLHLRVPEATVKDQRSDLDRLQDAILSAGQAAGGQPQPLPAAPLGNDLALLRALPSILRSNSDGVTVVLEGDGIQWVEHGDTTGSAWGVAFDIGTTTIVATLMNLTDGQPQGVAARTNPQVHYGDDVVSRITYIQRNPDGLELLRTRLVACLNEMILELCGAADIEPEAIYELTAVGNTTMTHIFLGIDPRPIAHAPYVAVFRQALDVNAAGLGLEVNPNANLHVLPNIAGFVGSDTVGVVLSSGMALDEEVRLGIDIGTNGEVVVGNKSRLIACSCAAGPAFEGARIRCGMRATEGAISQVTVQDGIQVSVIGGGKATGICGSGLIDAVAGLLDAGLIDQTGRMLDPAGQGLRAPDPLRRAVTELDGQPAVVLVDGSASKTGQPILLTQRDVREVQLAKAAIAAGMQVVAGEFGIAPHEVHQVLLAGGFGNFIRRSHARRVGMLPPISMDRIEFIGNAASAGAKVALVCRSCRKEAERISRETEYVELASRADFQALFMDALAFPPQA
jgi:uncharacterized 2Fe-2S/4Fe-4S cluster protein (DUF4445 family)